ncbi:bifunctional aspartate kinase/homoserine dehydrogenase I [Aureitalea sp. L0-47]|uniref:bifunctional aspartate kinase/homoserine dehydrogenase I n=1 Tax=Aureitalea sp. L0-47 TaxID=2816962 RepID=UPI0022375813|nr:bifunctional aspartate kinase/homoserine dehydrogenase I [Aureitalea sp. L0-47]MCW5520021.1 bifunctional aspartate kinase/homoserine dehydrogenase I [Aureitalea sp. L0-47]
MQVLKFGGTSVASSENIRKVVEILKSKAGEKRMIVVVSALGGMTDTLQRAGELANVKDEHYLQLWESIAERHRKTASELGLSGASMDYLNEGLSELKKILQGIYLINEFSAKTKDKVLSFGELLSSFIIAECTRLQLDSVKRLDSRDVITTDSSYTCAQVNPETTGDNIRRYFAEHDALITIAPGFISRSTEGETTTLGRGGSDYSAAIFAASLNASVLEIWTDVSGMFTANPKLVKQAFPVEEISYHEAMELSHFGAKVLYPPTIRPVLDKNIPIRIRNTFEPEAEGTLINNQGNPDFGAVKGISHLPNVSLITLEGTWMVGIPGSSKRLFEALSNEKINVILITQASSEHSICIAVQTQDADRAATAIDSEFAYENSLGKIDKASVEHDHAIIAVIGDNMKSQQGTSGKMFSSLGKNNVNIRAIAQGASERNISAVIDARDVKKALNTLHYRFFERQVQSLNLFVVGVGNVGKRLLDQIRQQQQHLYDHLYLKVRVVGLSNSRKMVFNEEGLNLDNWESLLHDGVTKDTTKWFNTIRDLNLRNSIFIDITANEDVANSYADYLRENIAIIACNKIACSSEYGKYQELKSLARGYNAPFLFETNVGAGLPVINTLNNLINSGDSITSIQAVLSGSLNFVFNNFNESTTFFDVVKQAQEEGYTEPDPRIDLSGVDVARKILILARESGHAIDMEDIENDSFLPRASLDADSVDDFYETLKDEADHFDALFRKANENGNRLKYVAEFNEGKAKVGLQEVSADHPFYNLDGKDNIVLFYTDRYVEQPLIIKGAGAGAEVTASGLFGDIISLGKR